MAENVVPTSGSSKLKKLEAIHERAALLLMQRGSPEAVAKELDVSINTVYAWRRSPRFKAYYRKLRREAYDQAVAVLQAASVKAVAKIIEAIDWDDPEQVKALVNDGVVKYPEAKAQGRAGEAWALSAFGMEQAIFRALRGSSTLEHSRQPLP